MRRSFVLVFVTLLALAPRLAAAQATPPKAIEIPVQVTGAAAGTLVELYLNNGKNAELVIDVSGIGNLVLDMGNSGKTKLTLYVDVCKDGKIVKMIFTDGEPPPKDEDCERRVAIAGFYNDCAKLRVTFDVSKLFGRATGCSHTVRNVLIAGGGVLVGGVALTSGGGGATTSTSTSTSASPPAVTSTTTTTTTTPQPPAAPPTTTPAPTPPPVTTPTEFTVTISPSYNHVSNNESVVCGLVITSPAQPGAQFSVQGTGIGLIANQIATGTLNSSGRGAFQLRILLLGQYGLNGSVTSNSMTRMTSANITVGPSQSSCPSAQ